MLLFSSVRKQGTSSIDDGRGFSLTFTIPIHHDTVIR